MQFFKIILLFCLILNLKLSAQEESGSFSKEKNEAQKDDLYATLKPLLELDTAFDFTAAKLIHLHEESDKVKAYLETVKLEYVKTLNPKKRTRFNRLDKGKAKRMVKDYLTVINGLDSDDLDIEENKKHLFEMLGKEGRINNKELWYKRIKRTKNDAEVITILTSLEAAISNFESMILIKLVSKAHEFK